MKTDVIRVSSSGEMFDTALKQVDFVAQYKNLSRKNTLHLRLMTEEILGLLRYIMGQVWADFWITDENGVYEVHLRMEQKMDAKEREELLAASTSGKNEAFRGFKGKLRSLFYHMGDEQAKKGKGQEEGLEYMADFSAGLDAVYSGEHADSGREERRKRAADYEWSLTHYKGMLDSEISPEERTELEKSVLANLADELTVGILGDEVEIVIYKKMI